jgi:hypothetical protein
LKPTPTNGPTFVLQGKILAGPIITKDLMRNNNKTALSVNQNTQLSANHITFEKLQQILQACGM